MGHLCPKVGIQGGAQGSPPKGLYKQRRGRLKTLTLAAATVLRRYSTVLQYPWVNSATSPVRQARGRLRGPSSPDHDASSRTCGYLRGPASAAQGRAACEEVHTTALPASICTTPTRYRSSVTARLVVIP